MKFYNWDPAKNELLKRERQISFEEVIFHIQNGDEVDIFEAGPLWGCLLASVRTVRESQVQRVSEVASADEGAVIDSRDFIVARVNPVQDFRACVSPVRIEFDGIVLPRETASALCVAPGDTVRIVPLRS